MSLDSCLSKVSSHALKGGRKPIKGLFCSGCYAEYSTEDSRCPTLTRSLPCSNKLHENQLALEAAIMELSNWVEAHGSPVVAETFAVP